MRYVWHNHDWVPAHEVRRNKTKESANIMSDIDEYQAVGLPGAPRIGSRSTHREALRRHGMIEVGNMSTENALKTFNVRGDWQ